MKGIVLALVLVLLSGVVSGEELLVEEWRFHVSRGIDDIHVFDLNRDDIPEIYAVSYDPVRTTLNILDPEGYLMQDTVVPRRMAYLYPTEEIQIVYVDNLDGDNYLDIYAGSQIHTGGINIHYFYSFEREPEKGLDRYYNRVKWLTKTGGLTSIQTFDLEGKKVLLTSSIDHNIRLFNMEGNIVEEHTLPGSVWDVTTVNLDYDKETEVVAGLFKQIIALDHNWETLWSQPTDVRFKKVYAADINMDNKSEILGLTEDKLIVYNNSGEGMWDFDAGDARDVHFVDIYGGMYRNIIIALSDVLYFLDGNGAVTWSHPVNETVLSFATLRLGGESRILVGTDNNLISYKVEEKYFKRQDAETFIRLAQDHYKSRNLTMAIDYAGKARELFSDLGDLESYKTAGKIVSDSETIIDADRLYEEAVKQYNDGRYNDSISNAKKAVARYEQVKYAEGSEKAEQLLSKVEDKRKADEYYLEAEKYFIESDYSKAGEYIEKAVEIYTKINDQLGLGKSNSLKELMSSKYSTTTTVTIPTTTTTLSAGGLDKEDLITYGALGLSLLFMMIAVKMMLKKS